MTEETKPNYEDFAKEYIQGMKDGEATLLADLPNKLATVEDKLSGLKAVLAAVELETEDFKEDNKHLVAALQDTLKLMEAAAEVSTEDSSEAATEETEASAEVEEEKAVEPEATTSKTE